MKFNVLLCCLISSISIAQVSPPSINELKDSLPNFYFYQDHFIEHTEVSNALWWQYYQVVSRAEPANKRSFLPNNQVWNDALPHPHPDLAKYFGKKKFLNYPVVGISYEQALLFCEWRSKAETQAFSQKTQGTLWEHYNVQFTYRLPTSEEWEQWAGKVLKGQPIDELQERINCRKTVHSSRRMPTIAEEIDARSVSIHGLHHLFGNVSEMTAIKGVAKGGNWMMKVDACKPSNNNNYRKPTAWLGFRCLLEVTITPKLKFQDVTLKNPIQHKAELDSLLPPIEIPRYAIDSSKYLLSFGYENADVQTEKLGETLKNHRVTQIDFVFTRYPYNLDEWRINYHQLLAQRVKRLIDEMPALNDESIQWRLIRQIDCENKEEAELLFHGFALSILPKEEIIEHDEDKDKELFKQELIDEYTVAIDTFEERKTNESVIDDFVDKHPDQFNGGLVVMDWTASMYPYACKAILLNLKNSEKYQANHFVFFNDGDQKKRYEKEIGNTGGIYFAPADEMERVWQTMNRAKDAGNGGDIPENDVEALLKAIETYPADSSVILIADNKSAIRDTVLIPQLNKPIHVVLCGMRYNFYGKVIHVLNPQYLQIIEQAQGSLYFEHYERYAARISDALPKININGHVFWVLDEDISLEGSEGINFVFKGNTIRVSEQQKAKPKELQQFVEFNEQNFPKLIELNLLLSKYKDKALKKKKVTKKIDNLMKQ